MYVSSWLRKYSFSNLRLSLRAERVINRMKHSRTNSLKTTEYVFTENDMKRIRECRPRRRLHK